MQMLSLQAKSRQSALALMNALSQFQPEMTTGETGKHLVSVQIGSDQHVLAVLDAVQKHFAARAGDDVVSTMTFGLDQHYSAHDR